MAESTIRDANSKKKYLSILHEYCEYDMVYSKSGKQVSHYLIKEVYDEGPYESRKEFREKVINFYKEEWGKDDEEFHTADSPTVLVNRFCKENNIPWEFPHYIQKERESIYTDTKRKKHTIEKVRNPEMKRWWQVYGIIIR